MRLQVIGISLIALLCLGLTRGAAAQSGVAGEGSAGSGSGQGASTAANSDTSQGSQQDGGASSSAQSNTTPVAPSNANDLKPTTGSNEAPRFDDAQNLNDSDTDDNSTTSNRGPAADRSPASIATDRYPNTDTQRGDSVDRESTRAGNADSAMFPQRNGRADQGQGRGSARNGRRSGNRGRYRGSNFDDNAVQNGTLNQGDVRTAGQAGPYGTRGWLGVHFTPDYSGSGARIERLAQSGPARRAGLQSGDVIVSLNGQDISRYQEVVDGIGRLNPNTTAQMYVSRNGRRIPIDATVGTLRQAGFRGGTTLSNEYYADDEMLTVTAERSSPDYHGQGGRVDRLEQQLLQLQEEVEALRTQLSQAR